MISFEFDREQFDRLLKKLSAMQQDETIMPALQDGAYFIQRWIMSNRLAGPRPTYLGVKTGNLSSSITVANTEKIPGGYQVKIGTNVIYAAIHEFGFQGPVNVASFVRGTSSVRSHVRKMNMPARPFMRPGISEPDNQRFVLDHLKQRLEEAVNKQ